MTQNEALKVAREALQRIKSHRYGTHNAVEHSKAIWDIATEALAAIDTALESVKKNQDSLHESETCKDFSSEISDAGL